MLGSSVSTSPNGWTDFELGLLWLQHDFEPQSHAQNKSGSPRLLILDGHNSHCSTEFLSYAEKKQIHLVCLPPHTTHALQPCDVGVFSPLSRAWKEVEQVHTDGMQVT
jgi:DDE superfamily endonuclease